MFSNIVVVFCLIYLIGYSIYLYKQKNKDMIVTHMTESKWKVLVYMVDQGMVWVTRLEDKLFQVTYFDNKVSMVRDEKFREFFDFIPERRAINVYEIVKQSGGEDNEE